MRYSSLSRNRRVAAKGVLEHVLGCKASEILEGISE